MVQSSRPVKAGSKWVLAMSTGGFTTLIVIVLYHVYQSYILSQRAAFQLEIGGGLDTFYKKTLMFDVCNGMSNQRLSLLYGVILSLELGRAAVLPSLVMQGMQATDEAALAEGNNSAPFSFMYDTPHFIQAMALVGVEVIEQRHAPPRELYSKVDLSKLDDPVEDLVHNYKTTNHLAAGCPLFRLHAYYFSGNNYKLIWAVLNGLQPSALINKQLKIITNKLTAASPSKRYNFLHLRMENDWVEHCKRWENIPDGQVRNNCMNNTETIDAILRNMNFHPSDPLYVATFWQEVSPRMGQVVLKGLKGAGYNVYTSKDFQHILTDDREINAMVDYEVAMRAHRFMGNSVSTFSAVALYQRRYNGQWASYYNTGNIPLSQFIPVEALPWVFSYTTSSPDSDYLVKAAVASSLRYKTLQAHCIFSGDYDSEIGQWLIAHGVVMITHKATWEHELWMKVKDKPAEAAKVSPIYTSRETFINSYMRVDLAVIPELDMYTFVLFTEPDVFFHRKVSLATFGLPLPNIIGVASDPSEPSHVDPGVMLVNLVAVRDRYQELKMSMLANEKGGDFGKHGQGGAGAYMAFFNAPGHVVVLPSHFAAKPYQNYDVGAFIVHFMGPKPADYQRFFETLDAADQHKCSMAFKKGLCPYMKKWYGLLNESEHSIGLSLWYACTALYAPHLQGICLGDTKAPATL